MPSKGASKSGSPTAPRKRFEDQRTQFKKRRDVFSKRASKFAKHSSDIDAAEHQRDLEELRAPEPPEDKDPPASPAAEERVNPEDKPVVAESFISRYKKRIPFL